MTCFDQTLTSGQARDFYNWLGARHDFGQRYERAAKETGLHKLALEAGQLVLNAGVGTGKEQAQIQEAILPDGVAVGVDLSRVMLQLTHTRVAEPGAGALAEADIRVLPFQAGVYDRIFCSYVLDLIPQADLLRVLRQFRRVLRPGGLLVNVSLTEGTTLSSRLLMSLWKGFYQLSPLGLGGCRPVRLSYLFMKAGFEQVQREVVIQLGMPSEIITAAGPA